MRRRRRSPDLRPAFFKVYMPHLSSSHLRIPVAFERHINGKTPQNAIVQCRGEKTWKLEIERDENGLFFNRGWSKFVQGNGLKLGEFLFFYYDKPNSSFTVKIFSRSFCEKKRRTEEMADSVKHTAFPSHEEASVKQEILSDDENIGGIREDEALCAKRARRSEAGDDGEAADHYIPEHPSFRVTLAPTYIDKGGFLHVPHEFNAAHLKNTSRVELRAYGKSWEVCLHVPRPYVCRFSKGWRAFVNDNGLRVGDVCVFELVDIGSVVFEVSIFKSSPR